MDLTRIRELFEAMPDLTGNPALLLGIAVLSFGLAFIGSAVGMVLGQFRLPLLIAFLGDVVLGAACNLAVSGIGALAGTVRHWRDGNISLYVLLLTGIPSLVGAGVAALVLTWEVSHFWSRLLIGLLLVVSAYNLLRPEKEPPADAPAEAGPEEPARPSYLLETAVGLFLGALAAVTGLMMGSLRLPLLLRYLKLEPRVAVGTNLAVGFLTAVAAVVVFFLGAKLGTKEVDWGRLGLALGAVMPPTVAGAWLGVWITGMITKDGVRRLAGWAVALTGLFMVAQAAAPLAFEKHRDDWAVLAEPDDVWWDVDGDDD